MQKAAVRKAPPRGAVYNSWRLRIMLCYSLEDGQLGKRGGHPAEGDLLTGEQAASYGSTRSNPRD